ncbi:MAG: hypothetical protein NTV51_24885 [Verrucomicrobia bacterium]|nr:hypothetical protein [Verrucomicrobiota bacterium]
MGKSLAFLALSIGLGLYAAEPSAPKGLKLTLALNQTEYVVGEPLTVTVSLKSTDGPKRVESAPDFGRDLTLLYKHESETDFRAYAEVVFCYTGGRGIPLPPEGFTYAVMLSYDGMRGYYSGTESPERIFTFFLMPGKYLLQVRQTHFKQLLFSNLVSVTVRAPEGPDAEAWKLWKDHQLLIAMMDRGFVDEDNVQAGLAKLRELRERFPTSTYAPYAQARLNKLRP